MFESHLAPPPGSTINRDLLDAYFWDVSLERSLRRRELAAKHRKNAPKTKGTAAAMSAALLVSPILPVASASAQNDGPTSSGQADDGSSKTVGGVMAKFGDQNGTVAEVQRALSVDDDGIFGPVTERAVVDFQSRSGLQASGVVDVKTWQALFRASVSMVTPDSPQAKQIMADLPSRPAAPKIKGVSVDREAQGGPGKPPNGVNLKSDEPGDAPASTGTPKPDPENQGEERGSAPVPQNEPAPSAPVGECGGRIASPVKGKVTGGFGDGRNHAGVDTPAPTGTPVHAAACGTVSESGTQSGYGNIVCIQHSSSFSTCYAHLSKMNVKKGAYVQVGEVIGEVGSTGRSTGPHLHFETRVDGRAQDPAPYLSGEKTIPGAPASSGEARSASTKSSPAQARAATASGGAQAPAAAPAPAAAAAPAPAPAPAAAPAPAPAAAPAAAPAPAAAAAPAPAPAPVAAPAPAPAPVEAPAPAPAQAEVPQVEAEAPGIVPVAPAPSPEPAPAPVVEHPEPVVIQEPGPVVEAPEPVVVQEPAPVVEAPIPEPAPVVDIQAPAPVEDVVETALDAVPAAG